MSYSAPTTSCGAARSSSAARRGSGGRLSFTPPYVDLPPPPYPHAVDCRRHGRRRGDRILFPAFAVSLRPISTVFLRMIKSIIVPLIFGTLVVGIAGHGDDMKRVGRLALKSIVYFEIVTTLALFIGLLAVNVLKPGVGVSLAAAADADAAAVGNHVTVASVLEHIVPQSFFEAAVSNEMLQIVFWSVLFAIGLSQVRGRSKET